MSVETPSVGVERQTGSVEAEPLRSRGRGPTPAGARRLLIVSDAFPPNGVIGALRVERIAERFAADGWLVDVLRQAVTPLLARRRG